MTHFTQSQASLPVYCLGERTKWSLFFLFLSIIYISQTWQTIVSLATTDPFSSNTNCSPRKGLPFSSPQKFILKSHLRKKSLGFHKGWPWAKHLQEMLVFWILLWPLWQMTMLSIHAQGLPALEKRCCLEACWAPFPHHTHCPYSASLPAWTTANLAHLTSLCQSTA